MNRYKMINTWTELADAPFQLGNQNFRGSP